MYISEEQLVRLHMKIEELEEISAAYKKQGLEWKEKYTQLSSRLFTWLFLSLAANVLFILLLLFVAQFL